MKSVDPQTTQVVLKGILLVFGFTLEFYSEWVRKPLPTFDGYYFLKNDKTLYFIQRNKKYIFS